MNLSLYCRASSCFSSRLHGFLFLLALSMLLLGCRKKGHSDTKPELPAANGSIPFSVAQLNIPTSVALHTLAIQPHVYQHGASGISLELRYTIPDLDKKNWPAGAEGLVMILQPQWQQTQQDQALQTIPPTSDLIPYLQLLLPFGELKQQSGKIQSARWHLPYAELHLPAQMLQMVFQCTIQPYTIPRDSFQQRRETELQLLDKPWANWKVSCSITPPATKTLQFALTSLSLDWNTAKARKQDFSFLKLGKGYPDLCYSLIVGRTSVFRSPAQRNSLAIAQPITSTPFYAAEGDSIMCIIADEDRVGADEVLHQYWITDWKQLPLKRTYTKSPIQQMNYEISIHP